eukprot:3489780-Alexandrium_andersonii.AAC.1
MAGPLGRPAGLRLFIMPAMAASPLAVLLVLLLEALAGTHVVVSAAGDVLDEDLARALVGMPRAVADRARPVVLGGRRQAAVTLARDL